MQNVLLWKECATYANTMEFIHLNVHPWLIINLYLAFSLVLVNIFS
jgi:hypothetical protein